MISNYFKIAFRSIKKDPFFSFLNIIGLGLGIATSVLIVQYLGGEWSVDKHHKDYENIYQVNTFFDFGEEQMFTATTPSPLSNKIVNDFPEVNNATRLLLVPGVKKYVIKKDGISFFETKASYVDSSFFSLFTYPFVEGNSKQAIQNPNEIVISKILSEKIFNGESALGQFIEIESLYGNELCKISGVVDTKKYRSHLDTELFINMRTGTIGARFANMDEWAGNNLYHTYLKTEPNTNHKELESKFAGVVEETAGDRLKQLGFDKSHSIIPLKDVYLKSTTEHYPGARGNITFFYIFAVIGLFILFIACINFMNLSTAKSSLRAKEVAVKKVLGAGRKTLAYQFFTETFVYVLLSLGLSVLLIYFGQNYLNNNIGLNLQEFSISDWKLGASILSILVVTTFVSGLYPSLFLSSFSPMRIFNGKLNRNFTAANVRKGLVVLQFVISIILIQGVLIIDKQMDYIQNQDLGFSKQEKLVIPFNTAETGNKSRAFKDQLNSLNAVSNIGFTSTHPGISSVEDMVIYGEQKQRDENIFVNIIYSDSDFVKTMGYEFVAGRNFENGRSADSSAVIVTQSSLGGLGYNLDNAVGKDVKWNWDGTENRVQIIGVIKDFHTESLKSELKPNVFMFNDGNPQYLVAEVNTGDLSQTLADVQQVWNNVNPTDPFEYYFLNDKVEQAYASENKMSSLILLFTYMAILISCLGLFGLAAFAADRRKKEIGIRKVLGANVSLIVGMLSKEFILLVIFAIVIASPIAYYFTSNWLSTFHYKIDMPWMVYLWAGIIAISICFITVSYQSIKAALSNPVKSLRSE